MSLSSQCWGLHHLFAGQLVRGEEADQTGVAVVEALHSVEEVSKEHRTPPHRLLALRQLCHGVPERHSDAAAAELLHRRQASVQLGGQRDQRYLRCSTVRCSQWFLTDIFDAGTVDGVERGPAQDRGQDVLLGVGSLLLLAGTTQIGQKKLNYVPDEGSLHMDAEVGGALLASLTGRQLWQHLLSNIA